MKSPNSACDWVLKSAEEDEARKDLRRFGDVKENLL